MQHLSDCHKIILHGLFYFHPFCGFSVAVNLKFLSPVQGIKIFWNDTSLSLSSFGDILSTEGSFGLTQELFG